LQENDTKVVTDLMSLRHGSMFRHIKWNSLGDVP